MHLETCAVRLWGDLASTVKSINILALRWANSAYDQETKRLDSSVLGYREGSGKQKARVRTVVQQWSSNVGGRQDHPQGFVTPRLLGPNSEFVIEQVRVRQGICISDRFPGDAVAAGPGSTL